MKRALRIIVPLILAVAVIGCMVWYLLVYDRDFTKDVLLQQARNFEAAGNHKISAWLYDVAYYHSSQEPEVAIELSRQYKAAGNYTKAEYTLSKAIAQSGDPSLYAELCAVYVEQDKLLDAVTMLDTIADPEVKAALEAKRPAAPVLAPAAGFYSQYISVSAESKGADMYLSTEYPSTEQPYTEPVALPGGETTIYALAVSEDGLVSPLTVGGYTIGGVIEQVSFTDAAVESAIRTALNVGADTVLYTDDLWTINEFTVPAEAKVYDDLFLLTYLRRLTIDSSADSDLSGISKLTALEELHIENNRLDEDELTAIAALVSLKKLTLRSCGLTSISALDKLTKLTYLDLGGNTVRNIGALSAMTSLQTLNLGSNALTDLASLSTLASLETLDVSYNSLTSLSHISGIASLKVLDASHNQLVNADDVRTLSALTTLSLANNALIDAAGVAFCTALTDLDVSNNTLTDISSFKTLPGLITLNFSYNQVSELPDFDEASPIVTVNGAHNLLTSLEPLSGLPQLNNVLMDYNEDLKSLEPLDNCPLLILVNAYGTKVTEVSFLTEKSIIVNFDPTT